MSQIRNAKTFQRVNNIVGILLGLAFIVGGIYLIRDAKDSFETVMLLFFYTLAFGLIGGLFIALRYRSFNCPNCGGAVENVEESTEGSPVLKKCKHCNTLWRIGTI